jgi:uncharacterized protein (TIGR03435 family)
MREDADNSAQGLFGAVTEQLGLRFKATHEPANVFVIDVIQMPSEN